MTDYQKAIREASVEGLARRYEKNKKVIDRGRFENNVSFVFIILLFVIAFTLFFFIFLPSVLIVLIKKEEGTIFACVVCGKDVPYSEAKGSYKQPYCKKCFKRLE